MEENSTMIHTWAIVLLLASAIIAPGQPPKKHADYVPDEKTAERIAEAVLVAQYGEERVNSQLPLHADGSDKNYWKVQGASTKHDRTGGGFVVTINKNSGCIGKILEHTK